MGAGWRTLCSRSAKWSNCLCSRARRRFTLRKGTWCFQNTDRLFDIDDVCFIVSSSSVWELLNGKCWTPIQTSRLAGRWLRQQKCIFLKRREFRRGERGWCGMHMQDSLQNSQFQCMLCTSFKTISKILVRLGWKGTWLWYNYLKISKTFVWARWGDGAGCGMGTDRDDLEKLLANHPPARIRIFTAKQFGKGDVVGYCYGSLVY